MLPSQRDVSIPTLNLDQVHEKEEEDARSQSALNNYFAHKFVDTVHGYDKRERLEKMDKKRSKEFNRLNVFFRRSSDLVNKTDAINSNS